MDIAARISQMYPQGLTTIIAIGGTRTAYCLHQGNASITDFEDYKLYTLGQYKRIISDYLDLGGKHLIIPTLSWQSFNQRGDKYRLAVIEAVKILVSDDMQAFYRDNNLLVRFTGIDTLKILRDSPEAKLAWFLENFNNTWKSGSNMLVWEIAPVPTFTIAQAARTLRTQATTLKTIHDDYYKQLSKIAYDLDMPIPHLYIGSARNGDLKLRSMLPFALAAGTDTRFYYLPYPSLVMTKETLETILNDLMSDIHDRAPDSFDYEDVLSNEDLEAKRREFERLVSTNTVIGLSVAHGLKTT